MCLEEKETEIYVMVRALIFDLDGTLADTIYGIQKALNIALLRYSVGEKSYSEVRAAVGGGAKNLLKQFLPDDICDDEKAFSEALLFYNSTYAKTCLDIEEGYDEVAETLSELKRRGYKMAVLSNKPDEYTRGITDKLFGAFSVFDVVLGQRDDVPLKPSPTVPLAIARALGVSADECAFVGDSEVDYMTAKNAGMYSVLCTYGYRDRDALQKLGASLMIDKFGELLSKFRGV